MTVITLTGGDATTMELSVRNKSKRTLIYEQRVVGSMGGIGLSSASCVAYVPAKQHCPCTCS